MCLRALINHVLMGDDLMTDDFRSIPPLLSYAYTTIIYLFENKNRMDKKSCIPVLSSHFTLGHCDKIMKMKTVSLILTSNQSRRVDRWLSMAVLFASFPVATYSCHGTGIDSSVDISDGFLYPTSSRPPLGLTQPLSNGYRETLQRPAREADHSPQSSDEVRNCGAIPPLPNIISSWSRA
jgi:hypothetical protein